MLIGIIIGFLYVMLGTIVLSGKFKNGISPFDFLKIHVYFLLWPIFYLIAVLAGIDIEDITKNQD
jgi:hypothetical protein